MSLQVILCSKDRPAQLDLSIRTLRGRGPKYELCSVVYKGSTPEFKEGYQICKEQYEDILFIEETDFRADILRCYNKVAHTMFMMDDDIFYRNSVPVEEIEQYFNNFPLLAFSLRLGENTLRQNPHNENERVQLPNFSRFNGTLLWDHTTVGLNFGYPLSLDCHVFRTDTIFDLMNKIEFKTPNFLEAHLQHVKQELPRYMACSKKSSCVGVPLNRVQDDFTNNAGIYYGVSVEEMNQKFLDGKRLDDNIPEKIVGAHQEIDLQWV